MNKFQRLKDVPLNTIKHLTHSYGKAFIAYSKVDPPWKDGTFEIFTVGKPQKIYDVEAETLEEVLFIHNKLDHTHQVQYIGRNSKSFLELMKELDLASDDSYGARVMEQLKLVAEKINFEQKMVFKIDVGGLYLQDYDLITTKLINAYNKKEII